MKMGRNNHLIFFIILSVVFGQTPIAVMDFQANGITTTENKALSDRLRNELVKIGNYQVIERALMDDILTE